MSEVSKYIENATSNIKEDRAATKTLLMSLMKYMQVGGDDRHREVGLVAAKYLETLQRSNEQLVKLAALMQKSQSKSTSISTEEKDELYDLINSKAEDEQ